MRVTVPVKIRTIDDALVTIDVPEGVDIQQIKEAAELEALRQLPTSGRLRFAYTEAVAKGQIFVQRGGRMERVR